MITVKHIAHGIERIYDAPYGAEYVGPHSHTGIGGPHISIPKAEAVGAQGVEAKILHSGRAYIMNASGATIGSYELGDPPAEWLREQKLRAEGVGG